MSARIFLDTNILVYATITDSVGEKNAKALSFLESMERNRIFISTQVINEYYSTLIRKNVADDIIQKKIRELIDIVEVFPVDLPTVVYSWKVRERYGFSIWDSLIVATALKGRCTVLYSEDLQHEQVIEKRVLVLNPFKM
ncbi:MAG: PIN domain-containing protein [Candidatus Aminicenantes bacterium]|nr:PIN domain-containing protein [Candidatus Aminicenantes bacterium]